MSARRTAAAAAVLVALTGLAGCAQPLPSPDPEPVPAVAPAALTTVQTDRVLEAVGATLAEADGAPSAELLAPRVTGPAAAIRAAEYVQMLAGDTDALTVVPPAAQTLVVPTAGAWPRTVMVVTEAPEDLRAPLLLTLVQDSPRAQYRLTAWARLFPGVQMPATTQPTVGSAPVAPDTTDLAIAPADVVAQYVDVLTNGAASPHAATFTADPLRAAIEAQRGGWTAAVADRGTFAETYQAVPDQGPWAISTADGGAIVVGTVQTVSTMTLDDSTLTIGDQTAALLGTATVTSNLTITWLSVVAFAVPPAGSSDPVTVLGAEHSPIQVTGA